MLAAPDPDSQVVPPEDISGNEVVSLTVNAMQQGTLSIESVSSGSALVSNNATPGDAADDVIIFNPSGATFPVDIVYEIDDGHGNRSMATARILESVDAPPPANPASIHGRKFHDLNANGFPDPGEPYLNGWTIELLNADGQVIDTQTTMDHDIDTSGTIQPDTESGWYWFTNLPAGVYTVREVQQPGWTQTFPTDAAYELELGEGFIVADIDFGNVQLDFGDAPDPLYSTLLASDGARHIAIGPQLGPSRDTESDGQPNATATGDDADGNHDEDGIISVSPLVDGQTASIEIAVTGAPGGALVDGWLDANGNGVFDHPSEHIGGGTSIPVVNGSNTLNFTVPTLTSVATGGTTILRLRISTAGGLLPGGLAIDGEVEDHRVTVVEAEVDTRADLSITKVDDVDPIVAGNTLTYTVTVSNAGPDTAVNVVVTDTLPAGVTFVSTDGCAEDDSGVPTCSLGDIPSGGSAQFTVTVSVDQTTNGEITNTVTVASATADPDGSNNTTTEDTTVTPPKANLTITKSDTPDPVVAGNNLTYTITVHNAGPQDAENVVVTDTLPAGVTFLSTSGCDEDPGGVPTCSLGTIAAGAMKQFTINVRVDSTTSGEITNEATTTSDTEDPVDDNTATEHTTVQEPPAVEPSACPEDGSIGAFVCTTRKVHERERTASSILSSIRRVIRKRGS